MLKKMSHFETNLVCDVFHIRFKPHRFINFMIYYFLHMFTTVMTLVFINRTNVRLYEFMWVKSVMGLQSLTRQKNEIYSYLWYIYNIYIYTISTIIYWVVVSNIVYFHPYLGKIPILTNIFQRGWTDQLVYYNNLYPWCILVFFKKNLSI